MSAESQENLFHIDSVDVDSSVKENVTNSEKTCDSGIESTDSCSATLPTSDCEVSPVKHYGNDISVELNNDTEKDLDVDSIPSLSSPTSVSPVLNDGTDNLLGFNEFSIDKSEAIFNEIDEMLKTKEHVELLETVDNNVAVKVAEVTSSVMNTSDNDLLTSNMAEPEDENEMSNYEIQLSDLENTSSRNLTTSTVSLNEHKHLEINNLPLTKSPYSRSAENISVIDQSPVENLNSSTKNLNTEKILSQFTNQKNKVSAVQKLTPEVSKTVTDTNQVLDARYSRIPKELLSQDLGSIVKNVHGIFSSVSGSLKNAYNQTHRVPKPPIRPLPKPVPNGKVMDDIFEDEAQVNIQNTLEKEILMKTEHPIEKKQDNTPVEEKETESESTRDILRLQIESLERVLAEQRKDNASLRERVKQQVDELQEKDQTFKDLEIKVDQMSKRVEQAEREKDAAVMRYASVECAAIEARRAAERAAGAERAALAEVELLGGKVRSAHAEKARICQLYDDKCHELSTSERELAKVREDVKELEGRLKWTQSKLRMEMDAYKDSAERAERLAQQVAELGARAGAEGSARGKQLESELKECQAAMILLRHEKEDLDRRLAATTQMLESCKKERDSATSALALATAEVEALQQLARRLGAEAAELAPLRARAALAGTLSTQLARESERAAQAEEALSRERARAETCARREAAALEHAARLTAQHVQQRARASDHEHKAQALALDNEALRERISTLEAEYARVQSALGEEAERRNKETRVLARKVAELTEEAAEATKMLEWEKGENGVLKKKHANAIKELNRELQRALKRCEQLEAKLLPADAPSTGTGSVSSLSSSESAAHEEPPRLQNGHSDLPDIQVVEPDRQALIERIVSLQRAAARRAERCEFLEEHCRQLTQELRGKSRLLRQLLCALPAGAVASPHSDAHKKEIARLGGGAMAAVWGGDAGGMTLELSLEMNTRLQAVLEDALLKNITLKENMDTLGEEIARLKQQMNLNPESKNAK